MSVVKVRIDGSERTATEAMHGNKFVHLLLPEGEGLVARKVPLRGYKPRVLDYPPERAKRHYRRIARTRGATKQAKALLRNI